MQRNRTLLSLVLGLALLVQGVSAAAVSCVAHAEPAAPVEATIAQGELPCHGESAAPGAGHETTQADDSGCCGIECPNMATCAPGHAAVGYGFPLNVAYAPDAISHRVSTRPVSQLPPVLLRPPIVLHG